MTGIKEIKTKFKTIFRSDIYIDIEENNNSIYIRFWDMNTTFFIMDTDYKNTNERDYILKSVVEIMESFDFSFTLEFYSVDELEKWQRA